MDGADHGGPASTLLHNSCWALYAGATVDQRTCMLMERWAQLMQSCQVVWRGSVWSVLARACTPAGVTGCGLSGDCGPQAFTTPRIGVTWWGAAPWSGLSMRLGWTG